MRAPPDLRPLSSNALAASNPWTPGPPHDADHREVGHGADGAAQQVERQIDCDHTHIEQVPPTSAVEHSVTVHTEKDLQRVHAYKDDVSHGDPERNRRLIVGRGVRLDNGDGKVGEEDDGQPDVEVQRGQGLHDAPPLGRQVLQEVLQRLFLGSRSAGNASAADASAARACPGNADICGRMSRLAT